MPEEQMYFDESRMSPVEDNNVIEMEATSFHVRGTAQSKVLAALILLVTPWLRDFGVFEINFPWQWENHPDLLQPGFPEAS